MTFEPFYCEYIYIWQLQYLNAEITLCWLPRNTDSYFLTNYSKDMNKSNCYRTRLNDVKNKYNNRTNFINK